MIACKTRPYRTVAGLGVIRRIRPIGSVHIYTQLNQYYVVLEVAPFNLRSRVVERQPFERTDFRQVSQEG